MYTTHLYLRKTHKYVDQYRHLDEEEYLCLAKVLAPVHYEEGNGYDKGSRIVSKVVVPAGVDSKKVTQALYDSFSQHGCSHEYDCCGCASINVFVKKISSREYYLTLTYRYNY